MELSKMQLGTLVTLSALITAIASGTLIFNQKQTYYCQEKDIVLQCDRLSSTGKTCYYGNMTKICTLGWKGISEYIIQKEAINIIETKIEKGKEFYTRSGDNCFLMGNLKYKTECDLI